MSYLNKSKVLNIFLHLAFWIVSLVVFALIFRLSESINKLDFIYALLFHISTVMGVYLNLWAIKKWFIREKYVPFFICLAIIIVSCVILNLYTFKVLVDILLPNYYFVSQFNSFEIGIIILTYIGLTTSIKLSKSWFDLQKVRQQIIESEKEKVNSELQTLKSQINPHFLFNSLNVIYSLTLKNDESTPDVILKLSDILRYVIYDSTQEKVLLSSELSLLNKYIDLQKYRIEEGTSIKIDSNIEYDVKVAPLLFLTLLENSFKHGIKSDIENVFINIKLYSDSEKVYFEIENNKLTTLKEPHSPRGIGLENIKKRLKLQYPNKHKIKVLNNETSFKVYLEILHED